MRSRGKGRFRGRWAMLVLIPNDLYLIFNSTSSKSPFLLCVHCV